MTTLTPEQREYKERTVEYLRASLSRLEAQLAQETQTAAADSLRNQLEDMQAHVELLEKELAGNAVVEPVADELCKQIASALIKQKFYMARKYITRLETIEPFYPDLDRLRRDAETGQVSRRTRSISQGNLPTSRPIALPPRLAGPASSPVVTIDAAPANTAVSPLLNEYEEPASGGWRQFFQLHYILSCLVVVLILCVMAGVGSVSVLEWLLKGL